MQVNNSGKCGMATLAGESARTLVNTRRGAIEYGAYGTP
jgi:hypothetical protein